MSYVVDIKIDLKKVLIVVLVVVIGIMGVLWPRASGVPKKRGKGRKR